ncbi:MULTISPECIES: helix-turn-helix domain-containing protein [Pseudomonadota]|uniref:Helix-turn-helix domain-containing protein n=1 Tax=Azoarcus taiwanensis TaxID=666964 RepID=A0A972J7L5_9RHOO|nr:MULTISPECIES: helix-turn-helix transcriptional regulator [Pseudomonadota]NMG01851.1 helix-turn-helix domain-containing protein [Azoarcus taiwanensis]WOA29709.1 helix-turn-helix transcriptional regulator [Alloalcanivorax xenomutans]
MNVGRAIRLCRRQRGASQNEVAQRANCSVSYLSMLENNKRDPTLSTITRIAQALHVPVGVLFVLASDKSEMGAIDEHLSGELARSAMAALTMPAEQAAND